MVLIFFLTTLLIGCLVIALTGCTYYKRKTTIETDISVIEQGIKKETDDYVALKNKNDNLANTKDQLESDIANLEAQKKSLQEKLNVLETQLSQQSRPQAEACGQLCQDVKNLKKKIARLEKSIEQKTLQLENR